MPKTKKKLKDYYACATIEVQIYFQAEDDDDAKNVAESIVDRMRFDSYVVHESIDYDDHKINEINLHE